MPSGEMRSFDLRRQDIAMPSRRSGLHRMAVALAGSVFWPADALAQVRTPVPLVLMDGADPRLTGPLMRLIADAADLEWQIQSVPFARMMLMAERGQALAFGIAKTAEREHRFVFSETVLKSYTWLVVRREHPFPFKQVEDLRERHVCVPNGVSLGRDFDAAKGTLFAPEQVGGPLSNGFAMLRAGRCDALPFTSHLGPGHQEIQDALRKGIAAGADVAVLPTPLSVSGVRFSAGRDQPLAALLPRIDAAVRRLKPQIAALLKAQP